MYYPIQIPYILNKEFSQNIKYVEEPADDCGGFAICYWEMQPMAERRLSVSNIIATDACIDLVANFDEKRIGFAGMSKTEFNYKLELPSRSFGVRMMPGAFHQLTGFPAYAAMDSFLPVEAAFDDFDRSMFFSLPFEQAKEYFRKIFASHTQGKAPDEFTLLFHALSEDTPPTVAALCKRLHLSPRQCQRLFGLHYGITPKTALSIVRFHKCMEILTSPKAKLSDTLSDIGYYDQPHFIKDFKRNIGITPLELIRTYQS
ncbi:helix-turn-helix transcriptional regulator [Clostridiaceae bacterium OttesenSCG-928-D20]|nr:helix-turn-helix transcriptional regulator [Clostridiaceae bacterium OttesenSCG-928-D20]